MKLNTDGAYLGTRVSWDHECSRVSGIFLSVHLCRQKADETELGKLTRGVPSITTSEPLRSNR